MNFTLIKNCFSTSKSYAYIVAAKRTPIGSIGGKLSNFSAPQLGAIAIKASMQEIKLHPEQVEEIFMGNVLQAGQGQAPARQAALLAGLPNKTICTTLNKVCASGMKATMLGAMQIETGYSNIIVSGGMESMSNAPFFIQDHRKGKTYGSQQLICVVEHDGLKDNNEKKMMGLLAEQTAEKYKISLKDQNEYAFQSYERFIKANKEGQFKQEIVPVEISKQETITEDLEYKRYNKDKMKTLKPAFKKNGTITAGNASKLNDAGVALILMSEQKVKELKLNPLGRIISYGDAALAPKDFTMAPSIVVPQVLKRANLKMKDIDYHEINEAFAVTALANAKELNIDNNKLNIYGGAIAMGHPIGFSGAYIIQKLLNILKTKHGKYGMASICNGGGGASAIIVENLQ